MTQKTNSRRMFSIILGGLAVATLAKTPVHAVDPAELDDSVVSIGGRATYSDPKDADEGTWFGGAQMRFYLSPMIGLEGSIDYRNSDFGPTEVHTYPVQASLLVYLIQDSWVKPFLLGGAGWYFTTIEGPDGLGGEFEETDNRFGPHAGGGLQIYLSKSLSIDGTYRYIWLEEFKSKEQNAVIEKDYEDSGHMITAGLNVHF